MSNKHLFCINGVVGGHISPFDRGLAYGDGVFRTIKMQDGLPCQWPLHYQKLLADCSAIGIVCPSAEVLMADMQQLFEIGDDAAVLKIIITRGEGERGYAVPAVTMPMRLLIRSQMPEYPQKHYSEGINLHMCKLSLAYQPKLAGIKHLNRLENVLARMEWNDPEIIDGIMCDTAGHIIECTAANIFIRRDNQLLTPRLDQCGVAGITRERIMQIAHTLDLKIVVRDIDMDMLLHADEMIVCNSLYGAWQVASIRHQPSPEAWRRGRLAADLRLALAS